MSHITGLPLNLKFPDSSLTYPFSRPLAIVFLFLFYWFFQNKLGLEDEIKMKIKFIRIRIVFPSILMQLENGQNEFYFYFTN